jgi:hypothetical protein
MEFYSNNKTICNVTAVVVLVIVLLLVYYQWTKAEKVTTMTINTAERLNNGTIASIMYGDSPDPRFNLMTTEPHADSLLTSNVYALGQENEYWREWQDQYVEDTTPIDTANDVERFQGNPPNLVTSNIFALGQDNAEWQVWRPEDIKSLESAERMGAGSSYGARGMGANRGLVVQRSAPSSDPASWVGKKSLRRYAEMLENNDNIFRGPPGYDVTITRDTSESNLTNKAAWRATPSTEKMASRDAQLVASLFSL